MSTNMKNSTKKRRVAEGGNDGEQPNDDGGSVHEELKTLSSHMTNMMQTLNQLLDSNRTQMAMMASMQGEIKGLKGEIIRLTNESNQMKQTINAMQTAQTTISQNTNSRFDVVDNKQKYHEVLLRNQKWKYSVPRPSREYWDGLDEDEDVAAEVFLPQIKQCTEEMRYGTGDGNIPIFPSIDAVLPYNEELLPHWKEFANALEQHQYCLKCLPKDTDTVLALCDIELPDTMLELLSKALESTHFNRFILGNNNLGQSGIDFALKYLKDNQILKEFGLCRNTIDNMEQIKQICQVVEEHRSIEKLVFEGCRGEGVNGYEMLQMIMSAGKNNLKVIDLTNSNISTGGDTFISDFLTDNLILECLDLSGNALDDNDAIAIAGALKQNKKLRSLDVTNNNISRVGWVALRKAEFDDTSLNSAVDSNHTCTISYGIQGFEMNGNSEYNFASKNVRQKKVYSILSMRNILCSNVGHFDDIPVEYLPNMLSTIQQYSEYHTGDSNISQGLHDVNPLSIVYEVCRYWDKSLAAYELLSL